jgi:hypothetical protein
MDEMSYALELFAKVGNGIELGYDVEEDLPYIEWKGFRANYGTMTMPGGGPFVLSLDVVVENFDAMSIDLLGIAAGQRPQAIGGLRLEQCDDGSVNLVLYTDQVMSFDAEVDVELMRFTLEMLNTSRVNLVLS